MITKSMLYIVIIDSTVTYFRALALQNTCESRVNNNKRQNVHFSLTEQLVSRKDCSEFWKKKVSQANYSSTDEHSDNSSITFFVSEINLRQP